ncbi:hypothetical protein CCR75_005740 [Bremia lactucae]|uniref:Selenoprotein O n=1 Tax=Bremia lactucae TaxID=4779 RepID=A0A976FRR3_BRELC|nr:hypothetical protein CCR75_005740 [Bremia lactucae]
MARSFPNGIARSFSASWRRYPGARFDNTVLRDLPIDKEPNNYIRNAVSGACYSRVDPTPLPSPELVITSPSALLLAGIEVNESGRHHYDDDNVENKDIDTKYQPMETLVPILAGNKLLPGSETAAQCYCGHQFGYFSGQLGDGAALYLGEVVSDTERWELQLKGSGLTPYSRTADGRKVLRSTLREFLCSEHMHALGVPTTRAGSVVMSRELQVLRDVFYNGNATYEPTAVVTRIAKTFLRFGSFEIFKMTDQFTGATGPSATLPNKKEMLQQMLQFTIRQYFPEITGKAMLATFFNEVVRRTATLVAKWQSIGFCHGVLNTDNMSIIGDTLDYGPFGFLEHFDRQYICNTSDESGRYRYEAQPAICKWNCGILANELQLVIDRASLQASLETFDTIYQDEYMRLMREKLGLKVPVAQDSTLVNTLFDVLTHTGADFTCTFRYFSELDAFDTGTSRTQLVLKLAAISETVSELKRKVARDVGELSSSQYDMILKLVNDPVRAREFGITLAMANKMKATRSAMEFLDTMTDTERMTSITTAWNDWLKDYIARIQDEFNPASDVLRRERMLQVNPLFILRNHVAQSAIDFALHGEYDKVQHIFQLVTNPFKEPVNESDFVYAVPQDSSVAPLCVSCSS